MDLQQDTQAGDVWNSEPMQMCTYICLCAYGLRSEQGDKVQWFF